MARWRAAKEAETGEKDRRPYLASECGDVRKCEKYRLEIIREISKKVSQIQNGRPQSIPAKFENVLTELFLAGLGEFRIRDLNDEINKLLREKRHWENQISALGGPHYRRYGPKMFDAEGREVPGNRGYKYFGAAKDLPGVRELFEQEPPPPPRKTRGELMRDVDADYYGYRDDDDGILKPLEEKAEKLAIAEAVNAWKERQQQKGEERGGAEQQDEDDEEENIYPVDEEVKIILCLIGIFNLNMPSSLFSVRKGEDKCWRRLPWLAGPSIYCPRSRSDPKRHRSCYLEKEKTGIVREIWNK